MTITVLISGASVAGNPLAWWLDHAGAKVTVLDRATAFGVCSGFATKFAAQIGRDDPRGTAGRGR